MPDPALRRPPRRVQVDPRRARSLPLPGPAGEELRAHCPAQVWGTRGGVRGCAAGRCAPAPSTTAGGGRLIPRLPPPLVGKRPTRQVTPRSRLVGRSVRWAGKCPLARLRRAPPLPPPHSLPLLDPRRVPPHRSPPRAPPRNRDPVAPQSPASRGPEWACGCRSPQSVRVWPLSERGSRVARKGDGFPRDGAYGSGRVERARGVMTPVQPGGGAWRARHSDFGGGGWALARVCWWARASAEDGRGYRR